MSELPAGSVSLEDENPSLESLSQPPPAPETPQATPETPPQDGDTDPEGTVVNPGGEKLVPLSAVADLRGKLRSEKAEREREQAELAELRGKKQVFEQAQQEWQRIQPAIQQLRTQQQAPPPAQVNDKAVEYAKFLDLYKADGTPDVDRAQKILELNAAQAREAAQHLVQPIYQSQAQQQSAFLREQVKQSKAPNGVTVDPKVIDQIWSMVPPELSQRPEIAAMLWRQAIAETVLQGGYKAPVTPPPPALVTESLGAPSQPTQTLSHVDRNMMSAANIGSKDYEKISANFKPGQRNELE